MKLRPTGNFVVVKRTSSESEEKTPGGLFIPGTAKDQLNEGTVEAVGSGRLLETGLVVPLEVRVGDKVVFAKHPFTEVKRNGETYLLMSADAILAVDEG